MVCGGRHRQGGKGGGGDEEKYGSCGVAAPAYRIFGVGTRHGHYAAVFDRARVHQLISHVANTVQLSRHVWIQFVFQHHAFAPFLRRHVTRLDARYREICRGKYLSNTEIIMNPDKKPHDHPEMGYDLTNNYAGLQKHATLKMQGPTS